MPDQARVPTTPERQGGTGWSLETAIDHLLSVISGNDKRYEERFLASQKALELGLAGQKSEISAALAAADRAVLKAEAATEKRFESVNEFRGTLDNQQRTLIPRSEVDVLIRGLDEKILNNTKLIETVQIRQREMESQRQGVVGGWGYAVGIVGFLLAIGSLIMIGIRFIKG
jgi:hypothetical protein